jgi:hypothetical protein
MTEKTNVDSLGFAVLDRDDGLQKYRRGARSNEVAIYVPDIWHGRGSQTPGGRRQVRQDRLRPQERATDYQLVAAWSGFLVLIGAGAFALGMAIHNEAIAQQPVPRPEPIYYCATGAEFPAFEPCKEMKRRSDV